MPFFPEAPAAAPVTPAPDFDAFRAKYRDSVPALRRFAFLNHASVGPLSDWVVAAVDDYLRMQQMADTCSPDAWFDGWRLARQRVGELLGDPDRGNVSLHSSTNEALIRAFSALPVTPGDEVLCPADEFPSIWHAATELTSRGATFVPVDSGRGDGIVRTEDVLEAFTPKTTVLVVSWVNYYHGYRHDLGLLGAECRRHGIWLVVDVIQGLGQLTLDAPACGAHFLAGQGAKWLCAPLGSGFLWVSPDVPSDVTPRVEGWLSMELNHDSYLDRDISRKANANRFAIGTWALPSAFGLRRACEVILEAGPQRCESAALAAADALDETATAAGVRVASDRRSPDGGFGSQRSAIVALDLTGQAGLAEDLRAADVAFSVREGLLRLSPHWYTAPAELERVLSLLRRTARPAVEAA